jgi:hypothetical protein
MATIFVAEFQHAFVECRSADDAGALMTAERLLNTDDAQHSPPGELDRLADALTRYGQKKAAKRLQFISARLRSAAFFNS